MRDLRAEEGRRDDKDDNNIDNIDKMCYKAMHHYQECDHHIFDHFVQCQTAIAQTQAAGDETGLVYCIPATGDMRNLEQQLDVQDANKPGKCP